MTLEERSSVARNGLDLDAATIIRVSRALSLEIVPETLIETLLALAVEHLGATRGVLASAYGGVTQIEAEATVEAGGPVVHHRRERAKTHDVPLSLLAFVARTLESVRLDDARHAAGYVADEYIVQAQPRAVLCVPLVRDSVFVGALYFEHAHAAAAFTAVHAGTWTTLAPQAAISLETARRYAEANFFSDRMAMLIDNIPALAWSTLPDGHVHFFNRRWLEYTGLTREQAEGRGWVAAIHADDAQALADACQRLASSGEAGEMEGRIRGADGRYRWFLFRAQPRHDERGHIVEWYGTNTDIEDRKRIELDLATRMRFWSLRAACSTRLAAASPDQLDERIETALRRAVEFVDLDSAVMFSMGASDDDVHPTHLWPPGSEIHLGPETLAALRRGETVHRGDGASTTIALPLRIGNETLGAVGAHRDQARTWSNEESQQLLALAEVMAYALARYRAAADLERSASALEDAQQKLAHVTRTTAMGELTASIAHEINQPLAAIVANANAGLDWLSASAPNLDRAKSAMERVARDAERAGQVLTRVRALLSPAANEMSECELSTVIESVLSLVRGQLRRDGVALEIALDPTRTAVKGDPVQLQQVVLNLVLNAADASREVDPSRRQVTVRAEEEQLEGVRCVVVSVEDRGNGFDGEQARLFEPFYTTKPTGLGMGLAISRSIIERHDGRIWAESSPGQGARFRFALEALSAQP